jgi:(4S)-4-hydroxy-5-phosphonooxypentane-2,3-dione isomerase
MNLVDNASGTIRVGDHNGLTYIISDIWQPCGWGKPRRFVMYVVCVKIAVKSEHVSSFIQATLENAQNTRREAGNARFDVIREQEDSTRFMLYEVYRSREDFVAHQQTAHYFRWKDAVAEWMAQPRSATKNDALFFGDAAVT